MRNKSLSVEQAQALAKQIDEVLKGKKVTVIDIGSTMPADMHKGYTFEGTYIVDYTHAPVAAIGAHYTGHVHCGSTEWNIKKDHKGDPTGLVSTCDYSYDPPCHIVFIVE